MAISSTPHRTRILSRGIVTLLALNLASQAATWDGGGANSLWSTPLNWAEDVTPTSLEPLIFDGTVRLTPVNDLVDFVATGLTFGPSAGPFILTGSAIALSGEVVNSTALEQTINFANVNVIAPIAVNTGAGTITFAGPITAEGGTTLTKNGSGTLKYTNSGTVEIVEGGGGAFTQNDGSVLFDGGANAVYNIGGEAWFGATANQNTVTTVNSGSVNISSWLALARGNGAGEVSSDLVLNGSSNITALNFSAGYFANVATSAPRGSITLNGTSSLIVTNAGNAFLVGESAGSSINVTLKDSSLLRHNAGPSISQIGVGGRALLNIQSPTATAEFSRVLFGSGGNGVGAIWNRGILNVTGGASVENFSLGSAPNAYGYYLHDTPSPLALQEAGVGGAGGGNGVMEVRSGIVSSSNWMTMNRTDGANVTASMLLLSGGTFQPPNIGGRFYLGQNGGADQYAHIDIGANSLLDGEGNSDINMMNPGRATNVTNLTVHSGGTIETGRIFAGQGAGVATVNFDGGTLVTERNAGDFGTNIDGVVIYDGGLTVNTKGFNTTVVTGLRGPTQTGLTSVPITEGGAGYLGRPVVKITGGDGIGATAVANFNEATGVLTGITVTSPGTGYTVPPTITLVGGGATIPATFGAATLAPNVNTGALTKIGAGTLTLTQPSTYGGGTTISGGILRVTNTTGSGTGTGAVAINNGGTLGGTGATTGALQVAAGGTLAGSGTHTGAATIAPGAKVSPGEGIGKLTVGSLVLSANSLLDYEVSDVTQLDQLVVTGTNGLTINGGSFTLFNPGGVTSFSANGVYNLIGYSGTIGGTGVSALDVLNESAGKSYAFGTNAGFVTLTIAPVGGTPNFWNVDANGNWSVGSNWTLNSPPNSPGAIANFGGGGTTITAPRTVTVDAPHTVGSIGFNSAQSYTIAGGSTLTLNNGSPTSSEITNTNGNHTISVALNAVSAGTQITVAGAGNTLTISGPLTGTTELTKFGSGTLVLNGANSFTGTTRVTAGTLETSGDGSIGSGGIVANSGSNLRVRGAAASISKPLSYELAGSPVVGIDATVNAPSNFVTDIPTGSNATISSGIAVASGSHVKTGGGTLTLTNPDANNVLSNVAGTGFVVREGGLVLNGGPTSVYTVANGELGIGDISGNAATLTLQSGNLTVGTFTSVGQRNGTSGATSRLVVNGGTFNTPELFSGFGGDVVGYNVKPVIDVKNDATVTVSNRLRLGESVGSVATMNVSDSAAVTVGGGAQIGFGGKGILNVTGGSVSVGVLGVGFGNNVAGNTGVGVVNQTGGIVQQAGGGGDWRIGGENGADTLAYGSYKISGATSAMGTGNTNFQIGANGRGVLEISNGAQVTSGSFPVVGRFPGSVGLLNVDGGTFSATGTGNLLIIGEQGFGVLNVSGANGSVQASGAPGGPGTGGGTGGIRLGHTPTGSGVLNLNGGLIAASGIAETNADGTSFVYLNGGTLLATSDNETFMQGLDNVVAGPGNAKFDTGAFNVTVGQGIARATGSGVSTIPVTNGGSGYLGQPLVSITGDGVGATAVANLNGAGEVTSVTITNPGINYTTAPTISLLGGGATTDAVLGAPTVAANTGTGGLTKDGSGTLTLTGSNTYTGPTVVSEGTLALVGSISGSQSITVESGAAFDVAGVGGGYVLGASQTLRGAGTVRGTVVLAGTVAPGATVGTLTFDSPLTFNGNPTFALDIASASSFDQLIAPGITLDSPVNLTLALAPGFAPAANTSWLVLQNTGASTIAQNFFAAGNQLSEGESFLVNGFEFRISYAGGTGNDILLTAVPEPSSTLLLLGGVGSLAGLRRFRRRQS